MVEKNIKNKEGFTIIEVVLVLAIAGLIFLMVFVAFPALQRSQKDTRRQSDIERLGSQITNFKTNNSGKIPGKAKAGDGDKVGVVGHYEKKTTNAPGSGTWGYFYDNYLLAGGDTFEDPDGNPYGLNVVWCGADGTAGRPMGTVVAGAACQNSVQRTAVEFKDQSNGGKTGEIDTAVENTTYGFDASSGAGHGITVVLGARCNGETAVASSGARDMALVYKKEGGGTLCIAN